MNELKPCPFCGGVAALKETSIYNREAVRIECPVCHIATEPLSVGLYMFFQGSRDVTLTREDAEEYVARRWNARVSELKSERNICND